MLCTVKFCKIKDGKIWKNQGKIEGFGNVDVFNSSSQLPSLQSHAGVTTTMKYWSFTTCTLKICWLQVSSTVPILQWPHCWAKQKVSFVFVSTSPWKNVFFRIRNISKRKQTSREKTCRTLFNTPKQNYMRNLERFRQSSLLRKIPNSLSLLKPSILVLRINTL